MHAVEVCRLTKYYGRRRAVDNLSFAVSHGEIFGFLGPNGAGKTTTIRTLLGYLRPTSGETQILGQDCRRNATALRSVVGYLPAEFTLEAGMTGDCLVRFWARLRGVKCDYGLMLAKRLTADLQHPVQRLSRGQKQKIGIVQALLHQPQVLILDEPTSGLDPLAREELFRMMREVKARGRTVFFSSHILSEVEKLCDRVAIIRAGTLVALEDIGTLRGRHTWKIHSVFARTPDIEALARLAEVSAIAVQGEEVTLRVSGDLASVLRWCAGYPLVDFTCEHPDLEEVFMRFYGEEQ